MHWTEQWIGTPYIPGEFECGMLVAQVVYDRLGILINLPTHIEWRETTTEMVHQYSLDIAKRIEDPQELDGVLMRVKGRKGDLGSHIGLYVVIEKIPYVLHNLRNHGVVLHSIHRLESHHLVVEGYYRWNQ